MHLEAAALDRPFSWSSPKKSSPYTKTYGELATPSIAAGAIAISLKKIIL
jgi:hypothetical protein